MSSLGGIKNIFLMGVVILAFFMWDKSVYEKYSRKLYNLRRKDKEIVKTKKALDKLKSIEENLAVLESETIKNIESFRSIIETCALKENVNIRNFREGGTERDINRVLTEVSIIINVQAPYDDFLRFIKRLEGYKAIYIPQLRLENIEKGIVDKDIEIRGFIRREEK